jgi:hypothetical protein
MSRHVEPLCRRALELEFAGVEAMRESPSIVPYGADLTVYQVVEAPGIDGIARTSERSDLETIIAELLSGRFHDPIRILAFNTLEHWTADMSEEVAREIQCRCDIEGRHVPDYLEDFCRPPRQATKADSLVLHRHPGFPQLPFQHLAVGVARQRI